MIARWLGLGSGWRVTPEGRVMPDTDERDALIAEIAEFDDWGQPWPAVYQCTICKAIWRRDGQEWHAKDCWVTRARALLAREAKT